MPSDTEKNKLQSHLLTTTATASANSRPGEEGSREPTTTGSGGSSATVHLASLGATAFGFRYQLKSSESTASLLELYDGGSGSPTPTPTEPGTKHGSPCPMTMDYGNVPPANRDLSPLGPSTPSPLFMFPGGGNTNSCIYRELPNAPTKEYLHYATMSSPYATANPSPVCGLSACTSPKHTTFGEHPTPTPPFAGSSSSHPFSSQTPSIPIPTASPPSTTRGDASPVGSSPPNSFPGYFPSHHHHPAFMHPASSSSSSSPAGTGTATPTRVPPPPLRQAVPRRIPTVPSAAFRSAGYPHAVLHVPQPQFVDPAIVSNYPMPRSTAVASTQTSSSPLQLAGHSEGCFSDEEDEGDAGMPDDGKGQLMGGVDGEGARSTEVLFPCTRAGLPVAVAPTDSADL